MTGAESYEGMAPPPWSGVALADRLWCLGGVARDLWLAEEGSTEGEALEMVLADPAVTVPGLGPDDSFAECPAPARQPKAFEVGDRSLIFVCDHELWRGPR